MRKIMVGRVGENIPLVEEEVPFFDFTSMLSSTGLASDKEIETKHCWEILECPPDKRESCPIHARRVIPSWLVERRQAENF